MDGLCPFQENGGSGDVMTPKGNQDHDLIVVGGGPAGMMAGLLFARAGCDVLVASASMLRWYRFRRPMFFSPTRSINPQSREW